MTSLETFSIPSSYSEVKKIEALRQALVWTKVIRQEHVAQTTSMSSFAHCCLPCHPWLFHFPEVCSTLSVGRLAQQAAHVNDKLWWIPAAKNTILTGRVVKWIGMVPVMPSFTQGTQGGDKTLSGVDVRAVRSVSIQMSDRVYHPRGVQHNQVTEKPMHKKAEPVVAMSEVAIHSRNDVRK